jgi:hypothetical protein
MIRVGSLLYHKKRKAYINRRPICYLFPDSSYGSHLTSSKDYLLPPLLKRLLPIRGCFQCVFDTIEPCVIVSACCKVFHGFWACHADGRLWT